MNETLLTIKEAFKGFRKNLWWNLVVLFLMVISFTSFSVFFVANENIKHISNSLNEELVVDVGIKEDVKNVDEIVKEIEKNSLIESVEFKTKEEVTKEKVVEMGEDADILKTFDDVNIFPALITVTFKEPESIKAFVKEQEGKEYVEEIYYGERYLDTFLQVNNKVKKVGIIATIISVVMVIAVIIFVIRMNVEQRKEEIYVKSLIGASGYVIKMPFIIETLLLAVIAYVCVLLGVRSGYDELILTLGAENLLMNSVEFITQYAMYLFALTFGIALLGSVYSTAKHVKKI